MNIPYLRLFAAISAFTVFTTLRGYCNDGAPSIFGATTVSGIRDWFAQPQNLFDSGRHADPSKLEYQTKSDLDWSCINHVSPNGRYVFCIQKTGSGDNSATLFQRSDEGAITPIGNWTAGQEFSDDAWTFFREFTGLDSAVYHAGVEFVAWGDDQKCVEFSLHGTDCAEDYYIRDWKLHYNITTRMFFVARGQRKQNQKAVIFRNRSGETQR